MVKTIVNESKEDYEINKKAKWLLDEPRQLDILRKLAKFDLVHLEKDIKIDLFDYPLKMKF